MTDEDRTELAGYRARRKAELDAEYAQWPRLDGLDPVGDTSRAALAEGCASTRLTPVSLPSALAWHLVEFLGGMAHLGSERAELLHRLVADAALASSMADLRRMAADEDGQWGVAMRAIGAGQMKLAADVLEAKADNVVPLARRPATLSP
jgi:hypothetical protein